MIEIEHGNNKLISSWGVDKETFSVYTTGSFNATGDFDEPVKIKEVKSKKVL